MEEIKSEERIKGRKTLRDHFVRELRNKKKPSGESGTEFKSTWVVLDILSFLTDTVKHKL